MDRVILPECSKAAGREITSVISIMDLNGVSISDLMSSNVRTMLSTASQLPQEYYPEIVYRSFIINSPMLFTTFYSVVKLFLDSRTKAALKVLGSKYQKDLLEVIPAHHLPVQYGGQCTAPLDSVDKGFYAHFPKLCLQLKKWDLTYEDVAQAQGLNFQQPHFPPPPGTEVHQHNFVPQLGLNYPQMPDPPK
jgi:hypothetical protein